MAENKRVDLTKFDGMGNGITTNDLQRQAIKDALAEELKDKRVLKDEALALIDEDERKLAELERLVKEKDYLPDGKPSDIAITFTADVDEAVTDLKRLQRELRKTTQDLHELERGLTEIADGRPISLDGPSITRSIADYIEDVEDYAVKLWREKGCFSGGAIYGAWGGV